MLSYVLGPLALALIVVGFALLGRAALIMVRTVKLGQPDGTRSGPV